MTKAQWIELRKQVEWPLELFFNYWNDVKPSTCLNISLHEFEEYFPQFMVTYNQHAVDYMGRLIKYKPEIAIYKIYKHYDSKFCINE